MWEYKERVREYFSHKKGEGLILSPANWLVIDKWEKMGIPLHVVIQGIDKTFENLRSRGLSQKKVHLLSYCEPEIMNIWRSRQKKDYEGSCHDGSGTQYEGGWTESRKVQPSFDFAAKEQAKLREYLDRRISLLIAEITLAAGKKSNQGQGESSHQGQVSESQSPEFTTSLSTLFGRAVRAVHLEEELAKLRSEIRTAAARIDVEVIEKRLQRLDEQLMQTLLDTLSAEARESIFSAARQQTQRYKNQMEPSAYQETVRACSIELLRSKLGIHQLSLYQ